MKSDCRCPARAPVEESPEGERGRLELLLKTARVLGSSLDREGILNALAESIITGLDAAAASFTDIDAATGAIHSVIHHVAPGRASMVTSPAWIPLTSFPFLVQVEESGIPASTHVADPDLLENERAFLTKHDLRSEVVVPILTGGRVSSFLEVYWDHPDPIGPHTVAVCAAIAEQATVALENARLYAAEAELRRRAEVRARRLEHVQRVGERLKADLDPDEIARRVVDATQAASGFRMVVLNLVNEPDEPDSPWSVVATAGVPPEGVAVLCANTYTVSDVRKVFRPEFRLSRSYFIPSDLAHLATEGNEVPSWWAEAGEPAHDANAWRRGDDLLVPLTERDESRLIGFISLDDPDSGLRPEREEVELLEIFADQAVVALRNANLLRQARRDGLERARTEEIVRASEARLRAVLRSSPILLFSLDAHGRFTLATGGDLGLLDIRAVDLPGALITSVFAQRPEMAAHYERALGGEAHSVTIDVRETSLEMHWTPLRVEAGAVMGVIGVAVDVTERVEAQRAAEALARLRSDFVASVSHELRTPLTAIVGYAELLQSHWARLPDERRLEHISRIATSANRQKRMVDDLLLLGRVELGDLRPKAERVLVARAISRAADEVRISYPGQHIDFTGAEDLLACADLERVVQILVNVLDNAAKYSPEGSPIAVAWAREGREAVVRVRDRGSGIPPLGREQLFSRFGRMPGSRTRAGRVGTGLGLHLGRQIAEAMGGSLDLEETSPSGSIFRLRVPLAGSWIDPPD